MGIRRAHHLPGSRFHRVLGGGRMANSRIEIERFRAAYGGIIDAMCAGHITWEEYEHRADALLRSMELPPRKQDRPNILFATEDQLISRVRRRERDRRYYERRKRDSAPNHHHSVRDGS